MPKVAWVLPRGVGGRQGVRRAPGREGSPRFRKSDRLFPPWGDCRLGHSATLENGVFDSKFSVQSETLGLHAPRTRNPPGEDLSTVNVPPWSSVSREVVTLPRSMHYHGRATAQRLGIGPGDPGQPGSGRFTRITQTPYISMLYTTLIQVIQVIQVKRQIG